MSVRLLLGVVTVTIIVPADPAFPTGLAPPAGTFFDTNSRFGRVVGRGAVAVDANKMTSKVVLATERAAACAVGAHEGLGAVGVMRSHVSFEVESTSETYARAGE